MEFGHGIFITFNRRVTIRAIFHRHVLARISEGSSGGRICPPHTSSRFIISGFITESNRYISK